MPPNNGVEIKVAGFAELEREFKQLPAKVQKKVVKFALRRAGNVARKGLRRAAPVRRGSTLKTRRGVAQRAPGFLKRKGIIVRFAKSGPNKAQRLFVGPSYDAFYGQIVDEGHRAPRRKGRGPGGSRTTRPRPWLHRGWNPVRQLAVDAFAKGFEEGLSRAFAPPRAPRKRRPRG